MHLADPIRLQVPDQIINNIVQAYNFCTAAPRMHICYANAHTSGSSVHQKQPEVLIEPLVKKLPECLGYQVRGWQAIRERAEQLCESCRRLVHLGGAPHCMRPPL